MLVYDIDHGHRLIKRIPTAGLDAKGVPNNVKGICACAATGCVYISTIQQLMCLDLATEKLLWQRTYEGGCDRMSITPDGRLIYLPSLEGAFWNVVRGEDGEILARVVTNSAAHNTIIGLKGDEAYLAGLHSPLLLVTSTATHQIQNAVGPFAASIRPFTVNGGQRGKLVNPSGGLRITRGKGGPRAEHLTYVPQGRGCLLRSRRHSSSPAVTPSTCVGSYVEASHLSLSSLPGDV